MPIATIVALLFLLIALLMVVYTFFPGWSFAAPVLSVGRIIGLVIGLVVLYIVYLLVMAILGTAVGLPR